jgi:hypothetical protein
MAKTGLRTLLHLPPVQSTNPAKTFAKALFYFMQRMHNAMRKLQA